MTSRSKPTLQTVADAVGVSRTTVSNAYNRPGQLTDVLRKRILFTAEELGYPGPDPAARKLRTGTTATVGVVFTESLSEAFRDATSVALLRGVAAASENTEVSLLLLPVGRAGDDAANAIRNASVDGFIVYSVPENCPAIDAVVSRRLPIITVDEPRLPLQTAGHIGIDDEEGAYEIAAHLLALGHRRLTVLVGRIGHDHPAGWVNLAGQAVAESRVIRDRIAGYRRAVETAKMDWSHVGVYTSGANNPQAARQSAAAVLSLDTVPTAILAASDQLALAVLNEAAYRGIAVPDALSVAGFDDVPRASVANPALTTVRQPLVEKGKLALRMLRDEAMGDIRLPTEVVTRASTGAAMDTEKETEQ